MTETITEDPELFDTPASGDEDAYDGLAAETIGYDPALFELEEIEGDDDDD